MVKDEKLLALRAKNREKARRWRAANPERNAANRAAWKDKNRDRIEAVNAAWLERNKERRKAAGAARYRVIAAEHQAYMKAWRERNRERQNALVAAWARKYPDRRAAKAAQRRAAKLHATPAWANEFFINEIYDLARLRTELTGIEWHVDHIVPLQSPIVCGLHVEHNLRVIPAQVNLTKGSRLIEGDRV